MAKQNRDAVYALLIGVESPNNLNSADIQTDLFHLTQLDNNSLKGLYTWQEQSVLDHDNINSYYAAYYQTLMQANYFIMRAEELIASAEYKTTDEEKTLLKQYIGEIKIMRALAHWRLIQRFSKPWDGTTDNDEQSGIILMKQYDPLKGAKSKKATRAEVYKAMIEDLDYAIANIADDANKDVKPAIYLTRDYAYAIKARVCLTMHDWQGAVDACNAFMDKYPINVDGDAAAKTKALSSIWHTEDSPEILVRLRATAQDGAVRSSLLAGSHQEGYSNPSDYKDKSRAWFIYYTPYLVLEKWVVDLYSANDIRKEVYVGTRGFYRDDWPFKFNTLTKYSGNRALDTDKKVLEFKFGVHLFNVAEAYLIKAEALAELGKTADAADVIVKLEKSRLSSGYPDPLDFGTKDEVLKSAMSVYASLWVKVSVPTTLYVGEWASNVVSLKQEVLLMLGISSLVHLMPYKKLVRISKKKLVIRCSFGNSLSATARTMRISRTSVTGVKILFEGLTHIRFPARGKDLPPL